MIVFVTTQMRTGSTWLCDTVASLLGIGWSFFSVKQHNHSPTFFSDKMNNRRGHKVFKLHHAHPRHICENITRDDVYCLSITRDIKDTILSNLFYIRYDKVLPSLDRNKQLQRVRNQIRNPRLGDKEYINKYIKEQDLLIRRWVREWKMYNDGYTHPKYKLITYEQMKRDPVTTTQQIANFLGIRLKPRRLEGVVRQNSFRTKSGHKPGGGNNRGFRRKGIIGDWKNWMNQESINIIDGLIKND